MSVVDANYELKKTEVGNTFTTDSDHGTVMENAQSIYLRWISNDTLQIAYDKGLRTFEKKTAIDGINIVYVER